VVCICAEEQTWNIIPHKYLVEPSGKLGADNFYGWNREEREDFNRLSVHFRSRRAPIALRPTSWTKSQPSRRTDN
jgi:hypothetical protein